VTSGEGPSDSVLVGRAATGDERAFAVLVHRHKQPLYRLLRRYCGDADEAYETAHEAFIAAWAALGRFDPRRPFLPWLRTIAINKARDRGRRTAFRRLLFGSRALEDSGALAHPDMSLAADEVVMSRQDMMALDRAISRLPAVLKEALLLTAFDGWSQQEAGDILGVSAKTIETRTHRARKILAETLDPTLKPNA
jgi:RNA polymerase sigma factor (sigma-70 family)